MTVDIDSEWVLIVRCRRGSAAAFEPLVRTLAGGEIIEYTKMMAESREQALDRMADEARQLGANAVVGVRVSTAMIMSGAAEILCYGTAVVCEDG